MNNKKSRKDRAQEMKEMLTDDYLEPVRREIEEGVRGFGLIDAIINDERCPDRGRLYHEYHSYPDAMRFYISAVGYGDAIAGTTLPSRGGMYEDFASEAELERKFIGTYIEHCLDASLESLRGRAEDMIDLWMEADKDDDEEETDATGVLAGIVDDLSYLQFCDAPLLIVLIDDEDEIVMVSKDGSVIWDMEDDADMPIPLS